MSNILITGGAGFIGSHLARKLTNDFGEKVTVVDNLSTGNILNVKDIPEVEFLNCDVNSFKELSMVFLGRSFDYIFHYAAVVGVERTLNHPISVLGDVDGIRNILQLAKYTRTKGVFFASSSEVYGEPVSIPQHEYLTPLNSRLPYAVVKNIGEAYFRSFSKEFGINYKIFRFFNTYGPFQSTDFVISRFLRSALDGQDIMVYGDGSQTRTFCYVDDNVDTCIKVMRGTNMDFDTLNIGSSIETSVLELAETIIRVTGSTSSIKFLPPLPEGDMTRRLPDNSAMLGILERDLIPLEDGLKRLIRFNQLKRL